MRLIILLSLAPFCFAQDKPPDFFRLPPHLKLWEGFPPPTPQAKPPAPQVVQPPQPPPERCVHARIVKPPNRDLGIAITPRSFRANTPMIATPPACSTPTR